MQCSQSNLMCAKVLLNVFCHNLKHVINSVRIKITTTAVLAFISMFFVLFLLSIFFSERDSSCYNDHIDDNKIIYY